MQTRANRPQPNLRLPHRAASASQLATRAYDQAASVASVGSGMTAAAPAPAEKVRRHARPTGCGRLTTASLLPILGTEAAPLGPAARQI